MGEIAFEIAGDIFGIVAKILGYKYKLDAASWHSTLPPSTMHLIMPPPANALISQSIQQPRLVCTWSAHAPQAQFGPSPLFPLEAHTLTPTSTGELFLFGGYAHGRASGDLYVISTRDFSTTLLQTSGSVPTPRYAHRAALIDTTTLLICGGKTKGGESVLHHDSIYLLNLGTSDPLMSSPTSVDQ